MKCGDIITYTLFRKDFKAYLEVYFEDNINTYGSTTKPDNFNDIMATTKMEQTIKELTRNKEKGYCKNIEIQKYNISVGTGRITAIQQTKQIRGQIFELPQEIYPIEISGTNNLAYQPNFDFKCHRNRLVIYEYKQVARRMQVNFEHSVVRMVPGMVKYVYDSRGMTAEYDV